MDRRQVPVPVRWVLRRWVLHTVDESLKVTCSISTDRAKSSELVTERHMFEVLNVLGSSHSLLCFDARCNVGYARPCYKHRFHTIMVPDAPAERGLYTHFGAFSEALSSSLTRSSALKSLTLHTSHNSCHLEDVKSLEVLFSSTIRIGIKDLVLRFPDCVAWNKSATAVNLVRWNTTLEKLTLCSTNSSSRLKDVTYTWISENHGRTLQVRYSGTDIFLSLAGLIEPLAAKFSLDYSRDSIYACGTDLSTLTLILLLDQGMSSNPYLSPGEWVQTAGGNSVALVTSMASMSAGRTTNMKHVQLRSECAKNWPPPMKYLIWSSQKQAELLTMTWGPYDLANAQSIELLFTSVFMSSLKELVLRFPDCVPWNDCATVVNLVRWNTTLEKVKLLSTDSLSRLKYVTYTWTSEKNGRVLQVKYFGTDFFLLAGLIETFAAKFPLDYSPDSVFPRGTDLSTLHLILSLDHMVIASNRNLSPPEWVQTFRDNMIALVSSVASMSARSTTLRDIRVSYEWARNGLLPMDNLMWSCQKQGAEHLTQTWVSYALADAESLEVLFASNIMIGIRDLVLRFPDCVAWNKSAAFVNLVRRNTTLEKLTLCSTDYWSRLKDVKYTWTSDNQGRALQVIYSGTDPGTDLFPSVALVETLAAKFFEDFSPDSTFPRGTDLSTLHLILSSDRCRTLLEWVQTFNYSMIDLVTSVASMSARSTALKDVQVSYQGLSWPTKYLMWSSQKQVEVLTLMWRSYDLASAKSMELLFESVFRSSVKELVLCFTNCVPWNKSATVVNLVRWNTTLAKLTLRSEACWSRLKYVTYIWTSEDHGRALQVKYFGTDLYSSVRHIEPLALLFSQDNSPDSKFPRDTDLSILHVILSLDREITSSRNPNSENWEQNFRSYNLITLVTSVASMSERSKTLKHVQVSYEWARNGLLPMNTLMWSFQKQAERLTHTWGSYEFFKIAKPLELLFKSADFMISVKELVLRFPDCVVGNTCATVANLVRWNTVLEKLTLCSTDYSSQMKDVTYTWTSENRGRALQVKYSGTDFTLPAGLIEPLVAKFSQEYKRDAVFPCGTDVSALHLIISSDSDLSSQEWVPAFRDNMIALVTSVTSMSARSTTLKHVQVSFEWAMDPLLPMNNLMWSSQKQAELLTLTWGPYDLVDAKSLELLFMAVFRTSVDELVLRFPDCVAWNICASVANLVRWNTTLKKLMLCSTDSLSRLKHVTYTWTSEYPGRAIQVKFSGTEFILSAEPVKPLAAELTQDCSPDSIFPPGTDLSTLHLILSLDQQSLVRQLNQDLVTTYKRNRSLPQWVQTFADNMIALVTSVVTMSARSTTLKHVRLSYKWSRRYWSAVNGSMWSCRKEVELLTQEKLLEMVGNELRGNTSLEALEVGFWKLIRRAQHVGGGTDAWHTSYGGPCLSSTTSDEYVVKVRM